MKKLALLKVAFDTTIQPYEVSAFRGAIIDKVGRQHEWFHNHDNTSTRNNFHYRYSLIQYKTLHQKGNLQPMLVCMGTAVPEIHKLFAQPSLDIVLNGRPKKMVISTLDVQGYELKLWNQPFYSKLYDWQALNQENHRVYQQLEGIIAQTAFLEEKLAGHIRAFSEGVGWHIADKIKVTILKILREKEISTKGGRRLCFDIRFKTNVFLPEYIGLGKGTSKGFGVVRRDR